MSFDNIILIGPAGAGKSTTACLLAQRMGRPHVALDKERFRYYEEIGYNAELAAQLRHTNFEELIRYYEPFNAYAVGRVLEDYDGCIIDFGAIHSVYDTAALFKQAQTALAPYPHVILLLPCTNIERSVEVLMERGRMGEQVDERKEAMWRRIIRRFLENPSNSALAKHTVCTDGKTPEEVTRDVLECIA
ncbi:hypothetical protein CCAX7_28340 [Capsulimonas corticalis]|uniref:Uncharacterized protein n=1 Tax=Capsulimonas corticalis TaxID=2219043 RepID=A0A402CTB6_9BACT|nr:shikimate kinase [Capsulimonas corticalis]BDI30783.1 hypothetical protein CCAX7_28340 [Capsulimonas corticalis]